MPKSISDIYIYIFISVGPQEKHIFDGTHTDEASFHLIDIVDPDVQDLIHNPEYRTSTASKATGYYYQCSFERLRKIMKAKYNSLAEKGEPLPWPHADDGLMEEIAKEKESELERDEEDELEDEDTQMTEAADAVQKARDVMGGTDKSKRLRDVVDDYMNELTSTAANGMACIYIYSYILILTTVLFSVCSGRCG